MSEWKEVPAWEALKALQEGTHEVQFKYKDGGWLNDDGSFIAGENWHHRIRPKVRTVDVIGLPVPVQAPNPYEVLADYWCVPLRYDTESEARRAYEALCAASK